jgi:hypothetical protein
MQQYLRRLVGVTFAATVVFTAASCGSSDASDPSPDVDALLSVTGVGLGSGAITSTPTGIVCVVSGAATSGNCEAKFARGTRVTLVATPSNGHSFDGWTGVCAGSGSCDVMLDQGAPVGARFSPPVTHAVTVSVKGLGDWNRFFDSVWNHLRELSRNAKRSV